ncbi:MAG: tyrosine-protein phosphatase [Gaiellaceae bacterium]
MIDLHSHILPGLDDGVRTAAESVELARLAATDGIVAIAATPHVREDYPTSADAMEAALAEVRAAVAAAGLEIRVLPGGEVALPELSRLDPDELRRFGLGGNPAYLLVETPYRGWPLDVEDRFFRLRAAGVTPVLAHPERNGDVQSDLERVRRLVRAGALVQVTASSLDGRGGRRARETALRLLREGFVHVVASDAHAPEVRAAGLAAAVQALGDEPLARWLTHDVPAAIVDGTELPPRPEQPPRRRPRFFRK